VNNDNILLVINLACLDTKNKGAPIRAIGIVIGNPNRITNCDYYEWFGS